MESTAGLDGCSGQPASTRVSQLRPLLQLWRACRKCSCHAPRRTAATMPSTVSTTSYLCNSYWLFASNRIRVRVKSSGQYDLPCSSLWPVVTVLLACWWDESFVWGRTHQRICDERNRATTGLHWPTIAPPAQGQEHGILHWCLVCSASHIAHSLCAVLCFTRRVFAAAAADCP